MRYLVGLPFGVLPVVFSVYAGEAVKSVHTHVTGHSVEVSMDLAVNALLNFNAPRALTEPDRKNAQAGSLPVAKTRKKAPKRRVRRTAPDPLKHVPDEFARDR
ncbi:MAG TPA: hypothetical protein DCL54_13830 [Alphaproteobacteria bacterium]|nr:hypothetical protein [Alphaproteobacteria bacterium]